MEEEKIPTRKTDLTEYCFQEIVSKENLASKQAIIGIKSCVWVANKSDCPPDERNSTSAAKILESYRNFEALLKREAVPLARYLRGFYDSLTFIYPERKILVENSISGNSDINTSHIVVIAGEEEKIKSFLLEHFHSFPYEIGKVGEYYVRLTEQILSKKLRSVSELEKFLREYGN